MKDRGIASSGFTVACLLASNRTPVKYQVDGTSVESRTVLLPYSEDIENLMVLLRISYSFELCHNDVVENIVPGTYNTYY